MKLRLSLLARRRASFPRLSVRFHLRPDGNPFVTGPFFGPLYLVECASVLVTLMPFDDSAKATSKSAISLGQPSVRKRQAVRLR